MAADGMICETRFDLPERTRTTKTKEWVEDPTLADEEQLDEDISILEEGPTAPDLEYL
jgi:hypothetical protein